MVKNVSIARLLVRCFGPLRIDGADDRLLPRSRKARAILAYLVMSGGAGASRDRLSGLLWGTRGQEQARASVRQALTEIRNALGEQRIEIVHGAEQWLDAGIVRDVVSEIRHR